MLLNVSCNKEPKPAPVPALTPKDITLEDIVINHNGTIIKYGFIGGWCSGIDSLTIAANDLWYVKGAVCNETASAKYLLISPQEKELLLKSFDQTAFDKLNVNTCYVCADGTDCWISVQHGTYFHKIRYGYGDSASITTIKKFVKELDRYMAKFK